MKKLLLTFCLFLSFVVSAQKLAGEWVSVAHSIQSSDLNTYSQTPTLSSNNSVTIKFKQEVLIWSTDTRGVTDSTIYYYSISENIDSSKKQTSLLLQKKKRRKVNRKKDKLWIISKIDSNRLILTRLIQTIQNPPYFYESIHFVRKGDGPINNQILVGDWRLDNYQDNVEQVRILEQDTLTLFKCSNVCECSHVLPQYKTNVEFKFVSNLTDTNTFVLLSISYLDPPEGVFSATYSSLSKFDFRVEKNSILKIVNDGITYSYRFELRPGNLILKLFRIK